jgi:hypothetical protein
MRAECPRDEENTYSHEMFPTLEIDLDLQQQESGGASSSPVRETTGRSSGSAPLGLKFAFREFVRAAHNRLICRQ